MNAHRLIPAVVAALCALAGGLAFASSAFAEKIYYPGAAFGGPCTSTPCGNGQFSEPVGVAVNDASPLLEPEAGGDVYVVDEGDDRVERFSASGVYLGQFNASGTYEVEGKEVKHGAAAPTGAFSSPEQIAVDDSGKSVLEDPSVGDVYVTDTGHNVVDKFSATGEYLGQVTAGEVCGYENPCEVLPFASLGGIAVDSNGNLWVEEVVPNDSEPSKPNLEINLNVFNDSGQLVKPIHVGDNKAFGRQGIALESNEGLYMIGFVGRLQRCVVGKVEIPGKVFIEGCTSENTGSLSTHATALAVVPPASGELANDALVDEGETIELYAPLTKDEQAPLETFPGQDVPAGFEGLSESYGVAVNASATVYASEHAADNVQTFAYVSAPRVVTEAPTGVSETGLTLHGKVSLEGEEVKECFFEYGTEAGKYASRVACEQSPSGEAAPVSAVLSGLEPAEARSFRLVVVTGAGVEGGGRGLTIRRPVVSGEGISEVGLTSASASAGIDVGGLASSTCYLVEYGTSTAYGEKTPEACLAAGGEEDVPVSVELPTLQADTTYHFRFVANNGLGGGKPGEDFVFTTFPVGSAELPDGRVYELASAGPFGGSGHDVDVYVPGAAGMLERGLDNGEANAAHGISSERPAMAAADGEAVAYVGDPPATGGNGSVGRGAGNQYVARRSASGGWTQTALNAPGFANEYAGFSSELSVGALKTAEQLTADAPAGYQELYARATTGGGGPFEPLFTATPEGAPGGFGYIDGDDQFQGALGFAGGNAGTSTVPAFSHMLFETSDLLPSTPEASGGGANNVYDSVAGRLYLVNVLPDGEPEANATVGVLEGRTQSGTEGSEASNAISADGSRIYWSAVETVTSGSGSELRPKALYVRENDTKPQSPVEEERCTVPADACTAQVDEVEEGASGPSGGGQFAGASSDGTRAFFTDEKQLTPGSTAAPGAPDLYEYDLQAPEGERLTDLSVPTEPGTYGDVQGVIGVSEDGSYVYFVADGVLSTGKNAEGGEPAVGQPNLYVRHEGTTTFISTLSSEDGNYTPGGGGLPYVGDWQHDPGHRTAEVSPDGRGVVFMSTLALTHYDNVLDGVPLTEVFVYNTETGRIACASCNPSGEPPVALTVPEYAQKIANVWGSFVPAGNDIGNGGLDDYQPRVISEGGSRVFFDSIEPLVPRDSNGYLDVYEWESEGTGSCHTARGCVYLLSGGQDPENSYFLDASATGDDVFFVSRAQLTKEDSGNDNEVLYDARVDGVEPPVQAGCSGTACQGVPPAPPIFATPASVTFDGVGNYPPEPLTSGVVKKHTVKTTKCKRSAEKKHGKCVKGKRSKKASRAKRATRAKRARRDRRISR